MYVESCLVLVCQYVCMLMLSRIAKNSIRFDSDSLVTFLPEVRFDSNSELFWFEEKKSRNLPLQCMCALLFLIPFLFNKRGAGPQGAGMRDSWFVICFRVLHACFSSWFVICFRVLHACFSSWFVICFRVLQLSTIHAYKYKKQKQKNKKNKTHNKIK